MPVSTITPPALEPLSLPKAAAFLRVDVADVGDEISDAIAAARAVFEDYTGLCLINRTLLETFDAFTEGSLILTGSEVSSVSSVQYYDETNTLQTLSSAKYFLGHANDRIHLVSGESWPTVADRPDAVRVTYIAGFGTSSAAIPAQIHQALKLLVQHFYDTRTPVAVGNIVNEIPLGLRHIMDASRKGWIG
jgi:uncharacterized phiE125 gp8 family phage protein